MRELDWLVRYVDGSVVRAHQHAAGARHQPSREDVKKGITYPPDQALGRSRGGLSTKLHLRVEGGGRPLVVLATAGQRHEAPLLRSLLDAGVVKLSAPDGHPGRGRPRRRPSRLVADKGYSYPTVRAELRRRGIAAVIPTRADQPSRAGFDKLAYRSATGSSAA